MSQSALNSSQSNPLSAKTSREQEVSPEGQMLAEKENQRTHNYDQSQNEQQRVKNDSIKQALNFLKGDGNLNLNKQCVRKHSLMESDINYDDEEEKEEEEDARRKINQKLIRKQVLPFKFKCANSKNYLKNIMSPQYQQTGLDQVSKAKDINPTPLDKRSRSETPSKMSATEILFRVHQKMQNRTKESPQKLLEKHQQRQKKAEELRAQIELSRKIWFEKIRIRQQIAKEKWQELMTARQAKLNDKLEQAEERRETEIQLLKNKAKQELQKIDETKYIVKMTMNNKKLDLDLKMNETSERRNQIIQEYKQKQQDRHLKEEAVIKRKQELLRETENRILTSQQKQEQAQLRRRRMLEEKKRIAEDMSKREQVLQRKHDLGDRISDIMSFVNNSENIWEFLGTDIYIQDIEGNGTFDDLYDMLSKDQFEIEKMKLKRDAELLDQLIVINEAGEIFARKELLYLATKRNIYKRGDDKNYSSSEEDDNEDKGSILSGELQSISPQKVMDELKVPQQQEDGYISDGSDKAYIAEESVTQTIEERLDSQEPQLKPNLLTDEDLSYMLYSLRVKQSMKRNVLKKSLSEDLTWVDFLQNENYVFTQPKNGNQYFSSFISSHQSKHSTPERKREIPSEAEVLNTQSDVSGRQSTYSNSKKHGSNKGGYQSQQNQNNSSSGNLSDKSRISSVVYPSRKKKNPNNKAIHPNMTQNSQELKPSTSQTSFKKAGAASNRSTKSLLGSSFAHSHGSFIQQDQQKEGGLPSYRKSTIVESDSSRKFTGSRMHSSSVQEQTIGLANLTSNQASNAADDHYQVDKNMETSTSHNSSSMHTGSQMTQLITNTKPILPQTKMVPKKLSVNASKLLFPIREQKLLFKRPGKEGQFGKTRITVRIEDLLIQRALSSLTLVQQQHSQPLVAHQQSMPILESIDNQIPKTQIEPLMASSSRKSLQSSPITNQRRQSTDTNNSGSAIQSQQILESSEQVSIQGAPNFVSRLKGPTQIVRLSAENSNSKKVKQEGSLLIENSPSPKKESKLSLKALVEDNISSINPNSSMNSIDTSIQMNEQGYKELLIKYLMTDNIQQIKTEDSQKTIVLEGSEAEKLIDYLEMHEFHLRFCRLCDLIIPDHCTNENHVMLKSHKRTREDLGIKESEDLQYSIFNFQSLPGDIERELQKEKEKALKRKVKRIKAQMTAHAVSHDTAASCPGKEITSANKKRFQILCIDLEKQVLPIIKDYEALENTLRELIKLLDMRKQADLHVMRKLKYIPILIEICKRISVCHKNEFKHLGRILEHAIKIINIFSGQRENRNYMLQTNRMSALVELLNWCLNRPTQLFYGIGFLPQLFHILTIHIKHRAPYECQQMRELFIEYLVCSQITMKIKSKFQIINGPLDLSEMMGQVPLILLKSATFIEALTAVLSIDAKYRPVYEKSIKIAEHVLFVIQSNELFGIIGMITTILLSRNQPFKPSSQSQPIMTSKVLPQTILSLAIISIKIINNVYRMDCKFAQQMMSSVEAQESLYHLFNYILVYTVETSDQQEDSKELLHETILMIGYFCLNNEKHQQVLCKGENTILQKLCNLPFPYFCDKKLKEILFPTLIQASYKNERSLAIMDQEISIEMLVDYLQLNLKEELPKIIEEENDYQSMSSLGHQGNALDRKTNRSPSLSSTNSSNCSVPLDSLIGNSSFLPLYMRFPKKMWKDTLSFFSKVLY